VQIRTFTKGYESHLANSLSKDHAETRRRYLAEKPWADHPNESIPSAIEIPDDIRELVSGGQENDLRNSHLLHSALRLTPAMAENRCLWARLAHVELWDYMRGRWSPDEHAPPPEKKDGERKRELKDRKLTLFLQRRYFVMKRNSRDLMRNGVARLWWAAELTKDGEGSYRDTQTLLWMPEIAERQYGQYPLVLRTLLRFVASARSELIKEGVRKDLRKAYFRPLLKRFNQYGGGTQLGQLDRPAIEDLLYGTLEEIQGELKRA
jgi:hypothetical protein